jgi:dephospho-CoA kinase
LIYQQIELEVEKSHGPYCVVAVPLLFETHKQSYFDRILVIDCDLETQVARVIARNQLNREQILAIISSQMPRELRLQLTDDLIENSATVSQLAEQIKRLHNSYNLLATARITSA